MTQELAIAAKYGTLKKFEANEEPKIMDLVIAKFSVDSCWYRAKILNQFEDKFKVFFVDFGNIDTVSLENIRKWNSRFNFLPFQAILCRLFDIKVIEKNRTSAIKYLESTILELYMDATVASNETELVIDLIDDNGERFYKQYLDSGNVTSF